MEAERYPEQKVGFSTTSTEKHDEPQPRTEAEQCSEQPMR